MQVDIFLKEKIDKIVKGLNVGSVNYNIVYSSNLNFGDFSVNAALVIYPMVKDRYKSARELAEYIVENLNKDQEINNIVSQIKIEGPGFINLWLKKEVFSDFLSKINSDLNSIIKIEDKQRNIMVEFAHPNTHKQFHLGHLRTLLIGGSLSKILEATGNRVFRANYQGDIGPHVAKAVYGFMNLLKTKNLTLDTIDKKNVWEKAKFLQEAYIYGNKNYDNSKEEIDELNNKIYHQDKTVLDVYNKTRAWSLEYFDAIYRNFGITFDKLFFESQTADCGKKIVLENLGKVFEEDNGAVIFRGEKYGLHTRVFLTKSQNPTYEGKDMCLAKRQYEVFPYDLNIHVVAAEQNEYFKVIFKALELIDPKFKGKEFHLSMGIVNLTSGKMSSRTGEIIAIEDLLEMVRHEIEKLAEEGRIKEDDKKDSIDKITRSAIVYAFLKVSPGMNLTFDVAKSVSIEGDSGPYILYTYARIKSVLAKAEINDQKSMIRNQLQDKDLLLARKLFGFSIIVKQASDQYSPNIICNYLYDLAKEFNSYYQEVSILKSETEELIQNRLSLVSAVAKIIKESLGLLNIETVERM